MKKAVLFLLCAVCVSFTIGAAALSAAPETRPIGQEECDRLRRSVGITALDQEPNILSLTGFDIRADGAVLLGTDDPRLCAGRDVFVRFHFPVQRGSWGKVG